MEHLPMEKTQVFRAFIEISDWAWDQVVRWDKLAQETVGKQLIRAVDSVGANLVEGDGRFGKGEGIQFFLIARGSAREARYWLERARTRCLLTNAEATQKIAALETATRQLNSLITYRRNKPVVKEQTGDYDPFTLDTED